MIVAADDRTGALETAGACASPGRPVEVSVWPERPGDAPAAVVDLGSRELAPAEAAARAAAARPDVLKLDSRLRGNWAAEATAVARALGRRLWVVAALPSMGRVCVDGVVREGERVLGRPGDALPATATVLDAAGEADLRRIGAAWRAIPPAERPVLAGTSAAVAAAVAPDAVPPSVALVAPVVVACGSLHPGARAELVALPAPVRVLSTPAQVGSDRVRAAAELAERVWSLPEIGTLVVVGGATAAAVLGEGSVRVGGLLAPGVPWARRADGTGPLLVTRSGGFHGPAALAAVLGAHCGA